MMLERECEPNDHRWFDVGQMVRQCAVCGRTGRGTPVWELSLRRVNERLRDADGPKRERLLGERHQLRRIAEWDAQDSRTGTTTDDVAEAFGPDGEEVS
jgi:hypothetical protein